MRLRWVPWIGILLILIPYDCFLRGSGLVLAKTVYVDKNATGDGSGTDWANACTTITAGLALSASGDQVWVKSATYEEAITMAEGVGLYGGFPSDGSPEFKERDWVGSPTIIDTTGLGSHCVAGSIPDATLDGFTVTGGSAENGGGVYWEGYPVTLRNCVITGNTATEDGGGVYLADIRGGTAEITDCRISGNRAGHGGGGIVHRGGRVVVRESTVTGNIAGRYGGGIRGLGDSLGLVNCRIDGNVSLDDAGGVRLMGQSSLKGCFIVRNKAADLGGGIYFGPTNETDYSVLVNCTVADNVAGLAGAGVYSYSEYYDEAAVELKNTILWNLGGELRSFPGSGPFQVNHSCVRGGWPGEGNIPDWPFFVDRTTGDYTLQNGSTCIDAGTDTGAPFNGSAPDIGAWESPGDYSPGGLTYVPNVVHVAHDAGGDGDGSDWERAFPTIGQALAAARAFDEVWVKGGTYPEAVEIGPAVSVYGGFSGDETNRGARNPVLNMTKIDASDLGRGVVIAGDGILIDGFVVTGGEAEYGGGIRCLDYTLGEIANCTVEENVAIRGGGLYSSWGRTQLENCTVSGNSASSSGGGIQVDDAEIIGCVFSGNHSAGPGGGVRAEVGTVNVDSCEFLGNSAGDGGALSIQGDLHLQNCLIRDNIASGSGGGARLGVGTARIDLCEFFRNSAQAGGALSTEGNVDLWKCLIRENTASGGGGGIEGVSQVSVVACTLLGNSAGGNGGAISFPLYPGPSAEFRNTLIVANSARGWGGGFYGYDLTVDYYLCSLAWGCIYQYSIFYPLRFSFQNCTIVGNSSSWGSGIFAEHRSERVETWLDSAVSETSLGVLRPQVSSSSTVRSCIFDNPGVDLYASDSDVIYSSIDETPGFVYPWDGHWGNFRLRETSPCVDAGDPDPAYDDACRPPGLGTVINDMGAYGGPYNCDEPPPIPTPEGDWTPQPTATVTPTPTITSTPTVTPTPTPRTADVTGDGSVDGGDLFFFSQWWEHPANEMNFRCDTTEDGFIDGEDLIEFIRDWRETSFAP